MVKGKDVIIQTPKETENKAQNEPNQDHLAFLFEEELNERILNRKRRNALSSQMVQDIKDMIKNGEFEFDD